MEWQPIETAPKDVEIWAYNGEQARMIWFSDSNEYESWQGWVWADKLLDDVDPSPDPPTHWMPLPQPPADNDG